MNKTLKFSRFSTKKRIIQYVTILTLIISGSIYTYNKVSSLLNERRIRLIQKYQEEVVSLTEDKMENLKKLEMEYDRKIKKLQDKIDKLQKKTR